MVNHHWRKEHKMDYKFNQYSLWYDKSLFSGVNKQFYEHPIVLNTSNIRK